MTILAGQAINWALAKRINFVIKIKNIYLRPLANGYSWPDTATRSPGTNRLIIEEPTFNHCTQRVCAWFGVLLIDIPVLRGLQSELNMVESNGSHDLCILLSRESDSQSLFAFLMRVSQCNQSRSKVSWQVESRNGLNFVWQSKVTKVQIWALIKSDRYRNIENETRVRGGE